MSPGRKDPALPFPGHADLEQQVCAGNRGAPGDCLARSGSHFRPRLYASPAVKTRDVNLSLALGVRPWEL